MSIEIWTVDYSGIDLKKDLVPVEALSLRRGHFADGGHHDLGDRVQQVVGFGRVRNCRGLRLHERVAVTLHLCDALEVEQAVA
jgi:hypothetical protein